MHEEPTGLQPVSLQSALICFIPKSPSKTYITAAEGNRIKSRIKNYMLRNKDSQVERVDVIWPNNTVSVRAGFLLALYFEQLRQATSVEDFKSVFIFKDFKWDDQLIEAHRIAKAMTDQQIQKLLIKNQVPTI